MTSMALLGSGRNLACSFIAGVVAAALLGDIRPLPSTSEERSQVAAAGADVRAGATTATQRRDGRLTPAQASRLARRWAEYVGAGDVDELDRLLADDYVHIHATALVEHKSQFVEALRSGRRDYDPVTLQDSTARVWGEAGIVTAWFRLRVFSNGRYLEGNNRITLVIAKTGRSPQVVSVQTTAIPAGG